MHPAIQDSSFDSIKSYCIGLFRNHFPQENTASLERSFDHVRNLFEGKAPGFQPIDIRFHDLDHTLRVTAATTTLLDGFQQFNSKGLKFTAQTFRLGILGALLHDSGYLKRTGDTIGTCAKFTKNHVRYSCQFADRYLAELDFPMAASLSIQNMIQCTGLGVDTRKIQFWSEEERIAGYCMGSGDYLGQMADPHYPDKLSYLYQEFCESIAFDKSPSPSMVFESAADLIRKTPGFWRNYVIGFLKNQLGYVYIFASNPYPDGPNPFIDAIEVNIAKIEKMA
ncbi:MAG: hypothetical protein SFY92_07215 [Verrucomicrobiae bacterium]|nr:hypothetical protein [Verrucomicrobiae bacterium]